MTTLATVAGHFPLTLVSGPGAEARNSIGIVLVGGMAIGTIFTKDRERQAKWRVEPEAEVVLPQWAPPPSMPADTVRGISFRTRRLG